MNGMIKAKNNMYGNTERATLQQFLGTPEAKKQLKGLLKDKAAYFAMALVQVAEGNEQLRQAEPQSIFNAGIASAILGLPFEKNLGFAYIVPYGEKAQFQIGYKGLIQLALRTGQYKFINSTAIKEGEISSKNYLTGDFTFTFCQDDDLRDSLKTIGYASYIELNNGFRRAFYMSLKQMQAHAQEYSIAFRYDLKSGKDNSVWSKNFDAMALKTVLKLNLSKYGVLSPEFEKAFQFDGAVINKVDENGNIQAEYIDNSEKKINIIGNIPEDKPSTEQMKNLLKLGENKKVDVFKKARELFGVQTLATLNMTQYDMLVKWVERS